MKLLTKKIATALALICSFAVTTNSFAGTTTRTLSASNAGGVTFTIDKHYTDIFIKTSGNFTIYHPNVWCSGGSAYCDNGRYYNFKIVNTETNRVRSYFTPTATGHEVFRMMKGTYRIMLNEPEANFGDNLGSITYRITKP